MTGTELETPSSLFGRSREAVAAALPDRERVCCPICGTAPQPFAVDFQGLYLARCGTCELEFHSPRPLFSQLAARVYSVDYHRPDEALVDTTRAAQFTRQLRHLERLSTSSRRRLLDVGCGAGAFLRFARTQGWTVEGSDVVVHEGARATGLRIWDGQLRNIAFGDERFDVIRFNHVLEHTTDPVQELAHARDLLTPDGILLVGVPNLAGLSVRLKSWQSRLHLKRRPWRHYAALHHFWFFTPVTLARVLTCAGFDTVLWETPVPVRPGRLPLLSAGHRRLVEALRAGSLMDVYARPAAR